MIVSCVSPNSLAIFTPNTSPVGWFSSVLAGWFQVDKSQRLGRGTYRCTLPGAEKTISVSVHGVRPVCLYNIHPWIHDRTHCIWPTIVLWLDKSISYNLALFWKAPEFNLIFQPEAFCVSHLAGHQQKQAAQEKSNRMVRVMPSAKQNKDNPVHPGGFCL